MFKHIYIVLFYLVSLSALVQAKDLTGTLFPEYKIKDQTNQWVTDKSFEGKWVVYYFYPKDHTSGCTVEAKNFAEAHSKFQEMGVEIVGISLDSVESHAAFAKDYNIAFSLLADDEKVLSKKLDMIRILPWPHTRRETLVVDHNRNIVKHYDDVDPDSHVKQLLMDLPKIMNQLKITD